MEVETAALANYTYSVWESSHTFSFTAALTIDMLRTDCKLDHFVNGPPVFKLVGLLSVISEVVPFINRTESWLNGLEER